MHVLLSVCVSLISSIITMLISIAVPITLPRPFEVSDSSSPPPCFASSSSSSLSPSLPSYFSSSPSVTSLLGFFSPSPSHPFPSCPTSRERLSEISDLHFDPIFVGPLIRGNERQGSSENRKSKRKCRCRHNGLSS